MTGLLDVAADFAVSGFAACHATCIFLHWEDFKQAECMLWCSTQLWW